MSGDQCLDRLYPALTAAERGLLVLRAYKAGEKPDPLIYSTTPSEQGDEFNGCIRLMNAVNTELAAVLFTIREQIGKLELKYAWLETVQLWAVETRAIKSFVSMSVKEPITASGYARREAEAREELLPLSACVEILIEEHEWREEDYVTDGDGSRDIPERLWSRVERELRQRLERLVSDGALPGRRRGRGIAIPAGAFYDWRGQRTPVYPDYGWEYEVRADDQAEDVAHVRETHLDIRRLLDHAPTPVKLPLDLETPVEPTSHASGFGSELARALIISIRTLVEQHWRELRATEIGVAEVAEEFNGEDRLHVDVRAILDDCLASCRRLREDMADYVAIELAEPAEEEVAEVREFIEKVAR